MSLVCCVVKQSCRIRDGAFPNHSLNEFTLPNPQILLGVDIQGSPYKGIVDASGKFYAAVKILATRES